MEIIRQNDKISNLPLCTATIGFFDGVHAGHQFLIDVLKKEAANRQQKSMVITFAAHPQTVLRPHIPMALITTLSEKLALLEATGIDYCVVLDFTKEMAQLSAQQFLQDVLSARYSVATLLVGYNHRFGHNRTDSFEQYATYGNLMNMAVVQAAQYNTANNTKINSSYIRQLLTEGKIEPANELLTRPYSFSGVVVEGQKLGRKIGFPTANLQLNDTSKLLPDFGVYAVRVIFEEKKYKGMMNIGYRPTVNSNPEARNIEVHLFNFNRDIYGQTLVVELLRKIREEKKFDSIEELTAQLEKDKRECENMRM